MSAAGRIMASYFYLLDLEDAARVLLSGLEQDKDSDGGDYHGGNVLAEVTRLRSIIEEGEK